MKKDNAEGAQAFQTSSNKLLIPTPAFTEFLALAYPDGGKYIADLHNLYRAEIASSELRRLFQQVGVQALDLVNTPLPPPKQMIFPPRD